VFDDGSFSTLGTTAPIQDSNLHDEDQHSEQRRDRARRTSSQSALARQEKLRLTIADCPGLLPDASDNVGLGHSFLRHIERSRVLIYVVDLSSRSPADDLRVLREELEVYQAGLSARARIVVANKADKVNEDSAEAVKAMKDKLKQIRDLIMQWHQADGVERTVLPMSAKMRGNVQLLVNSLVSSLSTVDKGEAAHARAATGQ
jgi:GTP-binding protein